MAARLILFPEKVLCLTRFSKKAGPSRTAPPDLQTCVAVESARKKRDALIKQGETELEAARLKARNMAQEVQSNAYALLDEMRKLQKDEKLSATQKAQRAREIARKESDLLYGKTDVVHNVVKEFVYIDDICKSFISLLNRDGTSSSGEKLI